MPAGRNFSGLQYELGAQMPPPIQAADLVPLRLKQSTSLGEIASPQLKMSTELAAPPKAPSKMASVGGLGMLPIGLPPAPDNSPISGMLSLFRRIMEGRKIRNSLLRGKNLGATTGVRG